MDAQNKHTSNLQTIPVKIPKPKKSFTYPFPPDEFAFFLSQKNQTMCSLEFLDDNSDIHNISSMKTTRTNNDDKFMKINTYCYLVSQRTDNFQSEIDINIEHDSTCE